MTAILWVLAIAYIAVAISVFFVVPFTKDWARITWSVLWAPAFVGIGILITIALMDSARHKIFDQLLRVSPTLGRWYAHRRSLDNPGIAAAMLRDREAHKWAKQRPGVWRAVVAAAAQDSRRRQAMYAAEAEPVSK